MPGLRGERLIKFTNWAAQHITGDEKGEAQIFLDRLFQAFNQPGCLDVGGTPEFRVRKSKEDGGDRFWPISLSTPYTRHSRPSRELSSDIARKSLNESSMEKKNRRLKQYQNNPGYAAMVHL